MGWRSLESSSACAGARSGAYAGRAAGAGRDWPNRCARWKNERRAGSRNDSYQKLRGRYMVVIEAKSLASLTAQRWALLFAGSVLGCVSSRSRCPPWQTSSARPTWNCGRSTPRPTTYRGNASARRSNHAQGRGQYCRKAPRTLTRWKDSSAAGTSVQRLGIVGRWRLAQKAIEFSNLSACADRRPRATGARRRFGATRADASPGPAHSRSCGPTWCSASSTSAPGSTTFGGSDSTPQGRRLPDLRRSEASIGAPRLNRSSSRFLCPRPSRTARRARSLRRARRRLAPPSRPAAQWTRVLLQDCRWLHSLHRPARWPR